MESTVYVDVFFMVNFSMDFLCLFLTSRLLSIRLSLWRGILAAIFGGIYANLALFLSLGSIASLLLDIAALVIICFIAFFRKKELRRLPILTLVFTAASMVLGGAMTALFNLFNRSGIFNGIKETDADGISVWLFAVLSIISAAITLVGGRFFRSRTSRRSVEVRISYRGASMTVSGLVDSGNFLREPLSGKPCIIVDRASLRALLPNAVVTAARNPSDGTLLGRINEEDRRRISLIPAVTATGGGMLLGLRTDEITLTDGKREYSVDAVIALSEIGGSAEKNRALVPACLLS